MGADIKISVVVPTFNMKDSLKLLIESLENQTYPRDNFEIIVCDDGSTDGTAELMIELCNKYHNLRYLKQEHRGVSAVRNLGIKHSKSNIIAFTDADCVADPNWLDEISKFSNSADFIGVYGPVKSPISRYEPFIHIINTGEGTIAGCNLALTKTVLDRVGYFDPILIFPWADDWDIRFRVESVCGKIVYNHRMKIYHSVRYNSFPKIVKGASFFRYFAYLNRKHPGLLATVAYTDRILFRALVKTYHIVVFYLLPIPFNFLIRLLIGIGIFWIFDFCRLQRIRLRLKKYNIKVRAIDQICHVIFNWALDYLIGFHILIGFVQFNLTRRTRG